ncbi:MAG: TonB family protein [Treponema sp.]|jgi:TonB family protein|nr:TonB family protein [Treponema sp.]
MWQSVTISPVSRGSALYGGICFFILAALHLVIPALIRPPVRQRPETKEMSLTFESFSFPQAVTSAAAVVPEVPKPLPAAAPELPKTLPPELSETALPVEAPAEAGGEIAALAESAAFPGTTAVPAAEGGGAFAETDYMALIMRRLEEKKVYPLSVRKRGIEGDVTVDFTIGRNGAVTGIVLADSAHRFLGQAAIETVRSASPFPAIPNALKVINNQEKEYPVRVTIRYRLEEVR